MNRDQRLVAEVRRVLAATGVALTAPTWAASADLRSGRRYGGLAGRRPPPDLAPLIDHTLLGADATEADVRRLCAEAEQHGFHCVCVNPRWVSLAASVLTDPARVCTVVGFPLGASAPPVKAFEAGQAIADGAHELDVVGCVGLLRQAVPMRGQRPWHATDLRAWKTDVAGVVKAARAASRGLHRSGPPVVKVILETALLTRRQVVAAALLCSAAGADFVKTSTGFSARGASTADVRLLRAAVGRKLGVKASGGIRDRPTALGMLRAGADRLGTSASLAIVR